MATGHHAQVRARDGEPLPGARRRRPEGPELRARVLRPKRSSSTLLLPIGAMNKSEVRAHAERLGLRTWDKPDSQDVCFIEASKGREVFLRQRIDLDAGR